MADDDIERAADTAADDAPTRTELRLRLLELVQPWVRDNADVLVAGLIPTVDAYVVEREAALRERIALICDHEAAIREPNTPIDEPGRYTLGAADAWRHAASLLRSGGAS